MIARLAHGTRSGDDEAVAPGLDRPLTAPVGGDPIRQVVRVALEGAAWLHVGGHDGSGTPLAGATNVRCP